MDDNKEKDLLDGNPEEADSTPKTQADDVRDEMEELAKTFQEELNKAKQQVEQADENASEEPQILIQELEDVPVVKENNDEQEIPEAELCECCGEKRRGTKQNPNSPYCIDCERGLRHYPFEIVKVLFAVLVICFGFYSCYVFANYANLYVAAEKADGYVKQNKRYSAYEAYSEAANLMVKQGVNPEMFYKRSIDNLTAVGGFDYATSFSTQFKSWELKLPHLRSVYNTFLFSQEFVATRNDGYELIYDYEGTDPSSIPYDEIVAKLDAMLDTAPQVTASADGTTTTAAYGITAQKYSKPMVLFLKYYLANICDKDMSVQIGILEQIKSEFPDYTWLYSTFLGDLYAKTGADTTELCALIKSVNAEDSTADVISAISMRIHGDYDGCIALCEKMIAADDDLSYEFYRQTALCYLIKGNYAKAYDNANLSYQAYGNSMQVCDTLAMCSVAVGNDETFNEMNDIFIGSELTLSDEVLAYKAGTMTLEQILLEGDYDV